MNEDENATVVHSLDALSAVVPTRNQVEHVEMSDGAAGATPSSSQAAATGLDFIGPSHAVKDLFSVPYSTAVNVAIHNVDGTLLIEAAADPERIAPPQVAGGSPQETRQPQPFLFQIPPLNDKNQPTQDQQQLIALPEQNDALAKVTALLQKSQDQMTQDVIVETRKEAEQTATHQDNELAQNPLLLPPPEHYAGTALPSEPHEYLTWQFQNMNLLVGSDALVYRPAGGETASNSQALTVRVADASDLRLNLQQYREAVQQGHHLADYQEQAGEKKSYADVLTPKPASQLEQDGGLEEDDVPVSSPDSTMLRLQSCIVPSGSVADGGGIVPTDPSVASSSASNTVCTVIDAYLDNIIANVPQLALCLYEKGFIQSVKLLQTQDIPTKLMHPSTLDMPSSATSVTGEEPLFSPQVMEMNASMLLRFLRSNCTRNNATYLLRREEGQTNIQLYDISSVSAQRQRKWIWWLAMMSYRFAVRLGQLSSTSRFQASENRSFRARQRSLLENALEMLQELNDRDGPAHETFCAAVCENLADTFLSQDEKNETSTEKGNPTQPSTLSSQPYGHVSGDALSKAQDHLVTGIKTLWPILEKQTQTHEKRRKARSRGSSSGRRVVVVVHTEGSSSSSSGSEEDNEEGENDRIGSSFHGPLSMEAEAVTVQLFGLHHKLINVNLRLAEHHLNNYWSSSAMQTLRTAARRIADAVSLLQSLGCARRNSGGDKRLHESPTPYLDIDKLRHRVMFQYTWLWERCGFFARSFAADELWRDRGHCCGDDIVSLLRDVEAAFEKGRSSATEPWLSCQAPISKKTNQQATLHSLSAVITILNPQPKHKGSAATPACDPGALDTAKAILDSQTQLKRDERRVLVAACVSYSRAIGAFERISVMQETGNSPPSKGVSDIPDIPDHGATMCVLRQRFGDACNEIGKMLLHELRAALSTPEIGDTDQQDSPRIAAPLFLTAAQFWFLEGLLDFEECKDLRNVALLRCNLCQCCKLRANTMFSNGENVSRGSSGGTHAEDCLQDAAEHLQKAHESLGQRQVDPMTWDMVSEELAATFLVLGVRRRQSLLGSGSTPLIMQTMRLNPGKERSVVEPMERSLDIYKQSGNAHQAAAVHYQLALFYSKVWTCQRDEVKTREKLSAAFEHYSAAHTYFIGAPRGKEPTFCILSIDLANLYAVVSGQECLFKALDRCLDTADAFSKEAVDAAHARGVSFETEWLGKMVTLASSIEDRVFKLLLSLVKLEKESSSSDSEAKELYRVALTAKADRKPVHANCDEEKYIRLCHAHELLTTLREKKNLFSST